MPVSIRGWGSILTTRMLAEVLAAHGPPIIRRDTDIAIQGRVIERWADDHHTYARIDDGMEPRGSALVVAILHANIAASRDTEVGSTIVALGRVSGNIVLTHLQPARDGLPVLSADPSDAGAGVRVAATVALLAKELGVSLPEDADPCGERGLARCLDEVRRLHAKTVTTPPGVRIDLGYAEPGYIRVMARSTIPAFVLGEGVLATDGHYMSPAPGAIGAAVAEIAEEFVAHVLGRPWRPWTAAGPEPTTHSEAPAPSGGDEGYWAGFDHAYKVMGSALRRERAEGLLPELYKRKG